MERRLHAEYLIDRGRSGERAANVERMHSSMSTPLIAAEHLYVYEGKPHVRAKKARTIRWVDTVERADDGMRVVAIALVVLAFMQCAHALAQVPRRSLMPQHAFIRSEGGNQDMRVHCLPIRDTRDIECVMTTTSLFSRTTDAPTDAERRQLVATLDQQDRAYRAAHRGAEGANDARDDLRRACAFVTAPASAPPPRRRAIEGGFSRATRVSIWRDAVCHASNTCTDATCVSEYLRLLRQHSLEVATIPQTACTIHTWQSSGRFSPAGVDRWQSALQNSCGIETTIVLERTFTPGRDAMSEDESPSWRFTQARRQTSATIPRDSVCQSLELGVPLVMATEFLDRDVAVLCDRVQFMTVVREQFAETVIEGFESRPEWMARRDQECDPYYFIDALDATEAQQRRMDAEYARCVEQFMQQEARRRQPR